MMIATYRLEFLTPCFCAGADQGHAELRAPAIRGHLRSWFRILGGNAVDEKAVFGGVHGNFGEDPDPTKRNVPRASALVVRVTDVSESRARIDLPKDLRFFTSSRGDAALPPGTTCSVRLSLRRALPDHQRQALDRACSAFFRLGALGLRMTRGCGSFSVSDLDLPAFEAWTKTLANIEVRWLAPCRSAYQAMQELEDALKQLRRDSGMSPNTRNAFGFVDGDERQASVVRLRPVRLSDGSFLPVVYHVPGLLGEGCKRLGTRFEEYQWTQ